VSFHGCSRDCIEFALLAVYRSIHLCGVRCMHNNFWKVYFVHLQLQAYCSVQCASLSYRLQFVINIHKTVLLHVCMCTHYKSKQHQLHVLAALVSTLAHTVCEWKAGLNLMSFDIGFHLQRTRCAGFTNTYGEFRVFSRAARSDLTSICLY